MLQFSSARCCPVSNLHWYAYLIPFACRIAWQLRDLAQSSAAADSAALKLVEAG